MIKIATNEEIKIKDFIFPGGEVQVKIEDHVGYGSANIEAHIHSSDDVMKLLMYTNALRQRDIERIYLQMPYVPYARQDRACVYGEALSIKVFADLINAQNYHEVEIWDAHSDVAPALLNRCRNLHCANFVKRIPNVQNMVFVAPDAGATKKVMAAAQICKPNNFIQATKLRNVNTGEIFGTEVHGVLHHLDKYLIIDDICDGGRTFIELAKELKKSGGTVDLYVTHGIFSKGFAVFDGLIDTIYCANPWPHFTESHNRHKV